MGDSRNENTSHGNEEASDIHHPRPPQNMQDLLRYAIEVGGDVRDPEAVTRAMNPERRTFLENALAGLTSDIVEKIKELINTLKAITTYKDGDDTTNFEEAMDCLRDHLDNIDLANDFYKLGGFDVSFACLLRGPAEVRWRAAELIAMCSQNNPYCQTKAIESNRLRSLMDVASNDSNSKTRLKAFYAVSCIVRENPNGLIQFLSLNGHKLILKCLKSSDSKIKTKAAFMLSSIAGLEPMFKDQLVDCGLVSELISLIVSKGGNTNIEVNDDESEEHILAALLAIITNHPRATAVTADKANLLIPHLKKIISSHSTDEAYQEEVMYAKQVLEIISRKS